MIKGPTIQTGSYPTTRMRRNRRHDWLRRMVRENTLSPDDFIWPIFVHEGAEAQVPIATLPGVNRMSIDRAVAAVGEAKSLGVPSIAVFAAIDAKLKTPECEEAWNPDNLVCRTIAAIGQVHGDIGIVCDVALDPFNADGHDGLVRDGEVANDETVEALCRQAIVQVEAGADIIAPSDMMDGRVRAIRAALDGAGFDQVAIMAYAAKYASVFYGPFRDAVGSTGFLKGAGKETYQMDPANTDEAMREVALDIAEGADMVMVKPALPYLDIIARVKDRFGVPTFAYNVSGEYAMLQFAAQAGAFDLDTAMMEVLVSFKRAGADGILTYFAPAAARLLADA
ncbi:MAG: porphobilinogen synthase [Alphaproteobacteria bacterium]|nr:porphobilinogen synthase [Alphaproteobacteria bacterium]MCZ6764010.1 porphobilinogen synthase [Alphaproteobacteria bacterium]